ncbi:MAG: hypothetical protein AVDCRST_MAG37-1618 [uncultured Rubrobacteraceae bacterium]|uniref:Uncharacterized protein n=1 Tax=uncultured Rubrobacteraceae bacterium TaxID=349277 RepID=A0A6J4QFY7_9ACTN|nr:MAG: hypothetical protein AVDCRST_MAG37-1618 [uncultured Rubrobacteraceae bacterium]
MAEKRAKTGYPPPWERVKEWLEALRTPLGAVFLAAYAASSFTDYLPVTAVFLGTGGVLLAISVPWASGFHKALALAALLAFGATVLTGRFDASAFFEGLPIYFNIIAVLLILSIAGYPIRAERFTAQIRALMAAMTQRGAGVRTTAGALGHLLGSVLDVGGFVLIDVILRRAAPHDRAEALAWAGRGFSFTPLWTNLNVFTVTIITLTGVTYAGLLAVSLPVVILGLAVMLLVAQREKGRIEEPPDTPLGIGAVAVVLYPVLLVAAVAFVSAFVPELSLTATISITVATVVVLIALLAAALLRSPSPLRRLAGETRDSLASSHPEFALFGLAGVLVVSLEQLNALSPVGDLFSALPEMLVAPALALVTGLGWIAGIHVIPLILLVNTAFPLDGGPAPALWAVAILLGGQVAMLVTPFSNAVTMLSRLTGLHPIEIGPKRNWLFALVMALATAVYLGLLTVLLL